MSLTSSNLLASEIGLGWNLCKSALCASIPRLLDRQTHSKVQKPKLRAVFALTLLSNLQSHHIKQVYTSSTFQDISNKNREFNEQICSMMDVGLAIVLLQKKLSSGLVTTADTEEKEAPFEMEDTRFEQV